MKKNEHRSVESKKKPINRDTHRERIRKKMQEAMDLFGDWLVPSTLVISSFLFTIYFKESMVSSVMNRLQDRDELVKK